MLLPYTEKVVGRSLVESIPEVAGQRRAHTVLQVLEGTAGFVLFGSAWTLILPTPIQGGVLQPFYFK